MRAIEKEQQIAKTILSLTVTAQEMDGQSDLSFESDEEMDEAEAPQPSKKRKA